MAQKRAKVGLSHGQDRRPTVYGALDLVRDQVTARVGSQVLIKPNFLTSTNQLASSHADAIRGVVDFLMSVDHPPAEILVAEGGNESYSGEAFDNFGYRSLESEFPVAIRLLDLNQERHWTETPVLMADGSEDSVRMPRTVLDHPCTISVAIAKTHDTCVVTLALKNMVMGTIHVQDRIHMHGYRTHGERKLPEEAVAFNVNLARLARFLAPDISVIDGMVGLQGNGPGGTDAVHLGLVAAGVDVFAVDAVMTAAMGFDPGEMGTLHYGQRLGLGISDLDAIDILGSSLTEVARPFKPHETTPLQLAWHRYDADEVLRV